MALRGISRSTDTPHESDLDDAKGTPQATRFFLRPLDVATNAKLADSATTVSGDGDIHINAQATAVEYVRHGLVGWANFLDQDGNDIPFKTVKRTVGARNGVELASDESLDALGLELVRDLASKIRSLSSVSKADAKN